MLHAAAPSSPPTPGAAWDPRPCPPFLRLRPPCGVCHAALLPSRPSCCARPGPPCCPPPFLPWPLRGEPLRRHPPLPLRLPRRAAVLLLLRPPPGAASSPCSVSRAGAPPPLAPATAPRGRPPPAPAAAGAPSFPYSSRPRQAHPRSSPSARPPRGGLPCCPPWRRRRRREPLSAGVPGSRAKAHPLKGKIVIYPSSYFSNLNPWSAYILGRRE